MSQNNSCVYNSELDAIIRQNSRKKLQSQVDDLRNDLSNLQHGIANDIARLFTTKLQDSHECYTSNYSRLMAAYQDGATIQLVKNIVNSAVADISARYAEIALQLDTLLGGYEGTIAELQATLATKVDKTTKVNGYTLDNDVELDPTDIDLTEIDNSTINNLF